MLVSFSHCMGSASPHIHVTFEKKHPPIHTQIFKQNISAYYRSQNLNRNLNNVPVLACYSNRRGYEQAFLSNISVVTDKVAESNIEKLCDSI